MIQRYLPNEYGPVVESRDDQERTTQPLNRSDWRTRYVRRPFGSHHRDRFLKKSPSRVGFLKRDARRIASMINITNFYMYFVFRILEVQTVGCRRDGRRTRIGGSANLCGINKNEKRNNGERQVLESKGSWSLSLPDALDSCNLIFRQCTTHE